VQTKTWGSLPGRVRPNSLLGYAKLSHLGIVFYTELLYTCNCVFTVLLIRHTVVKASMAEIKVEKTECCRERKRKLKCSSVSVATMYLVQTPLKVAGPISASLFSDANPEMSRLIK